MWYVICKSSLSSPLRSLYNGKLLIIPLLTKYTWRDEQTSETHKGCFGGEKIKFEVLNQSQKKLNC